MGEGIRGGKGERESGAKLGKRLIKVKEDT